MPALTAPASYPSAEGLAFALVILSAAKNPRSCSWTLKLRSFFAPSKATSFPRKRESIFLWTDLDPRLRGGEEKDYHFLGWAAGP
jgi:hypothetical protein